METLQAAADKEAREDSHSSGGHEDDQINDVSKIYHVGE